jgi:hypothetical protein
MSPASCARTSLTIPIAPGALAILPSPFNVAVASSKMALASAPEITLLVTRRSKSAPMMATLAYPNSCALRYSLMSLRLVVTIEGCYCRAGIMKTAGGNMAQRDRIGELIAKKERSGRSDDR